MALTLRVSSHHAQHMGANATRIFESGGDIGRVASNDWVLPDPDRFVSGQHARIVERQGQYFIADLSTNGTHLNGRQLPRGSETPIGNGDVIGIGDYQISVMIDASMPDIPPSFVPASMPNPAPQQIPVVTPSSAGSVDPLDLIPGSPPATPQSPVRSAQPENVPPEQEFFAPPAMAPASPPPKFDDIPEDWMKTGRTSEPQPPPAPSSAPAPVSGGAAESVRQADAIQQPAPNQAPIVGQDHLNVLLQAAGLDPQRVDPGTVESVGAIFRTMVQGIVELLQSRAEFKNQFRIDKTMLKSIDNNPLKQSASAEDALSRMFLQSSPAFQNPSDAFQEAIDDVKAHQVALIAGIRAGYKALLTHFDPERLEEVFDGRAKRGRLLDVVNRQRYWDLYRQMCDDFGDDDQTFRRLFGEEFVKAYELQMRHLTRLRKRG